jgi:hypothetical protein
MAISLPKLGILGTPHIILDFGFAWKKLFNLARIARIIVGGVLLE